MKLRGGFTVRASYPTERPPYQPNFAFGSFGSAPLSAYMPVGEELGSTVFVDCAYDKFAIDSAAAAPRFAAEYRGFSKKRVQKTT